jgi:hypothetical protein
MDVKSFRPSFEVVKEGRIFLTEKMSWKYFSSFESLILQKVMG